MKGGVLITFETFVQFNCESRKFLWNKVGQEMFCFEFRKYAPSESQQVSLLGTGMVRQVPISGRLANDVDELLMDSAVETLSEDEVKTRC